MSSNNDFSVLVGHHDSMLIYCQRRFFGDVLFKMNSEGKVAHFCFREYPLNLLRTYTLVEFIIIPKCKNYLELPLTSYYSSLVNPAECKGYSELSYLIMIFKQPTYVT